MRTVLERLSGDPNSHHSSFLSLLTRPEEPPSSSSPLQVVSQDNKGLYSGCYQTIQFVNSAVEQHQYTVRSLGLDTVWNRSKTFQYFQSICIKNITIANRRKTVRALVVFISTLLQQTRELEYQYDSKVNQKYGILIDDDNGVSWWSLDINNESQ